MIQSRNPHYPVSSGPRPPAHIGCRSTVVLVGKGESIKQVRELIEPRPAVVARSKDALDSKTLHTRTGRVRKPSKDPKRSPLKGTRTYAPTYETWMRNQPKYYQEAVLGKRAAARLRGGESLTAVLKDTRSSINFDSLSEALQ